MILGVGLGDTGEAVGVDASFVRFGEEKVARTRGEMLDEALEIVGGLWSGQPFSFQSKHFVVDDVTFLPPPVQQPRIPIWIGGGYPNPRPTRRAARWDGSCLYKETHGQPWENCAGRFESTSTCEHKRPLGGTWRRRGGGRELRDNLATVGDSRERFPAVTTGQLMATTLGFFVTRGGAPKRCRASGTSPWKFSSSASTQRSVAAVPFSVCGVSSAFSPVR